MAAALEVSGLTLRFGGLTALESLDLSLARGAVLGLAGPNGSGKSSLVNVLTGHYRAEGRILLDGSEIGHLPPHARARLGILRSFQAPRLYRRLTIAENLRAGRHALRPLWQSRAERRREDADLRAALALFGLTARPDDLPDRLTPFDLRLLELARAHLAAPRLLLLDEPAAGATRAEVARLARVMADHLLPGRSAILIEHRLDLLEALCGRVMVLRAGRRLAEGPTGATLARPEVRELLTGEVADA